MRTTRNLSTSLAASLPCLTILSTLLSLASADVLFTTPAPGATLPVGTIEVAWKDSGSTPSLQDLTQYTLDLMMGGNAAGDMLQLATFTAGGIFAQSDDQATGMVSQGIAASVDNGFFFRMTSTVQTGGTIVNYSSRFSIANLTGTTAAQYRQAAEALQGSTAGPPTSGNGITLSPSSSTASTPISTSTSTAIPSPTTTASEPSSPRPPPPSALSESTEIGIIIAIAIAFVLASGVAMFFLLRARWRKQSGLVPLGTNPFLETPAELPSHHELKPQFAPSTATELYAGPREVYEIGDGLARPELDHMAVRAELPG